MKHFFINGPLGTPALLMCRTKQINIVESDMIIVLDICMYRMLDQFGYEASYSSLSRLMLK